MHFLPDVWVECEECGGKRYQEEVLAIKMHGRSISDVLDMPIGEAVSLFADQPRLAHILQTICDVGLDYITLGQSAPTLSGGEAQRIKLAAELARPDTGSTLYLLDEPTTGLHFNDIIKLLNVLQRLVNLGNSVVVIEHNLDVIKIADWVIDIGPEAGSRGGTIVAQGPPEAVAAHALVAKAAHDQAGSGQAGGVNAIGTGDDLPPRSYTGEFLAPMLDRGLIEAYLGGRAAAPIQVPPLVKPPVITSTSTVDPSASDVRTDRPEPTPRIRGARTVSPSRTTALASRVPSTPDATFNGVATEPFSIAAEADESYDSDSPSDGSNVQNAPWRVLGRRWHSLPKGFPQNAKPKWPLEMAEKALSALESVAGPDRLAYDSPDRVDVRGDATTQPWAQIETKSADSLRLTLIGPADAIDLDLLERIGVNGPVDISDLTRTRITLNLTDITQTRARSFKSFLQNHWDRTHGNR
jgi:excinuclease ABC subunit A